MENFVVLLKFHLIFLVPIDNKLVLVQVMTWYLIVAM